jgi:hypothetical protein
VPEAREQVSAVHTDFLALHDEQIELHSGTRTPCGSLFVSLSDITQLLGTGSVPVVVAGSVLGVFELGEKLTSQRAKDALSSWFVSFDLRRAGALPDGTREIFERIFGERHLDQRTASGYANAGGMNIRDCPL